MRAEVLEAINTLEFESTDFSHDYDWSKISYDKCRKYVESENYNIEVEVEEVAKWDSKNSYERHRLYITDFKVIDENGKEIESKIKDKEILTLITT